MNGAFRVHAPGRVNLIGDHTDHMGGLALPCAIDLGITITGRCADDIVLTSSFDDATFATDFDDARRNVASRTIDTPSWGRYVAAVASLVDTTAAHGIHASIHSDLPAGAGLSSSAALEIAVALALGCDLEPMALARLGQRAEHLATGAPTGLLDQIAITHAVAGHALAIDFTTFVVEPVAIPDEIDVVVIHSGETRTVEHSAYAERVASCAAAVEFVGPLPTAQLADIDAIEDPILRRRARHVRTECLRVTAAVDALRAGDIESFGDLMVESHRSLRDDFEVSTPRLDELVERALAIPGVHGARLTGAGFGGCVVAVCDRGAIDDPESFSGRGWITRPSAAARLD